MSYNIVIPSPNLGEYQVPKGQASWKDQAIMIVKKYKSLYGAQFNEASKATNLPVSLLVGFAGVEGGGAENEKLTGRNGTPSIMQIDPRTVWQTLSDQLKTDGVTIGSMYPFYKAVPSIFTLKKPLPTNFWASSNIKVRQQEASDYLILKDILKDVNAAPKILKTIFDALIANVGFAIMIGATHLGQLFLESIKQVGSPRLDHIIIKYNGGVGTYRNRVLNTQLKGADTATLVSKYSAAYSPTTPNYITKLMGKNGLLDVQKQGLA